LGNLPVLTPLAAEVTTRCGDGVGCGTGVEVEERLFLYGVYVLGDGTAVNQRMKYPIPILPYLADALFAVRDDAVMGAQITANVIIF